MLVLLLLFASSSTGEVPNCYQEGVTWNHDDNALEIHVGVETLNECQRLCKNNGHCQNSTWNTPDDPNHPLLCTLFATTRHPVHCKFCVSGPWNCPTCSKKMACDSVDDNLLEVVTGIDTEVECQMKCADTPTCTNYTWYAADNIYSQDCFLFSSCNQVDDTCPHCFTGPPVCPETNTTTSPVCSTPPSTPHGTWHCRTSPDKKNYMECNLDCEPGYIHSGRIATNCTSGTWSTPLEEMTCPAALALVTGGTKIKERSVELYSSDGSCNKFLPPLPHRRKFHTIDNVNGDILLCGGSRSRQRTSCLKMSENSTMVHHSTTTGERREHSSVVMGGQLILIGGQKPSRNTTEFISPSLSSNWTEGFLLQEESISACAVKLTWDTFLVTGGYHTRTHVVLYNITDGTGRRLKNDLNYARWGHGCTLVQNETYTGVMVAGGYREDDHSYIHGSTELLDVTKLEGTWVKAGRLNIPRSELSIVVLEDKTLAMGGSDGVQTNNGHSLSSVEQFNLSTFSWTYSRPLLQARGWHAVTTVPATMFKDKCDKD